MKMPRAVIKIKDWYLIWSTIVDAPIACCKEDELVQMVKTFFDGASPETIHRMVTSTKENGVSNVRAGTIDSVISYNHAGPKGRTLTRDEIYNVYCLKQLIDDWTPYCDEDHNPT